MSIKDRIRRLGAVLALALVASLAAAGPALAAPVMFSGYIDTNSQYIDMCLPGGTGVVTYFRAFFIGGDATTSCAAANAGTTASASVKTGMGSFTLPPDVFTGKTSFATSFPLYPYFFGALTRGATGTGTFAPSYLTPSLMTTFTVNTTAPPYLKGSYRTGIVKFTAGPNGFGGSMPFYWFDYYFGTLTGSIGQYDFVWNGRRDRGSQIGGAWNSSACIGCKATQQTNPVVKQVTPVGTSRMGFFTGNVSVYNKLGFYTTTRTAMGADTRTGTFNMSGMISLVSPNMIYSYDGAIGSLQQIRNGYSSTDTIQLTFLPEPGRLALLASGLLGLLALRGVGRTRRL